MESIESLKSEIEQLNKKIEKLQNQNKILDLIGAKFKVSMHCAIIEAEHGQGNEAGMAWITAAFAVSGDFPPDSETSAEEYYQRNSVEGELEKYFNVFLGGES